MAQGNRRSRRIEVELPEGEAGALDLLAQINKRSAGDEIRAAIDAHLEAARLRLRAEAMSDRELDERLSGIDDDDR